MLNMNHVSFTGSLLKRSIFIFIVLLFKPYDTYSNDHPHEEGVSPEKALVWMKNGNIRFTMNKMRNDGVTHHDIERLSKGQKPHAIVLSCSDSRVPPELVFDQKLGEIFTVRSAGESPDESQIASIEYAIEHLGSRLIVVLGHTSCGAVKAALETPKGKSAGSKSLDSLIANIQHRFEHDGRELASTTGHHTPSVGLHDESFSNVRGVVSDLLIKSEIIKHAVETKKVKIVNGLYRLNDGVVEWSE